MTTPSLRNSISRPALRRGLPRKEQLPRTQAMWIIPGFLLIPLALALAWLALAPTARAVDPPPDGGYLGENTAEGKDALFSLTTGVGNTAIGYFALFNNTTGSYNTALGHLALFQNTTGGTNTAICEGALYSNTTGGTNTANGYVALFNNTTGVANTATGHGALYLNKTGNNNTANGWFALDTNTTGNSNTATGFQALSNNTTGSFNIALGFNAGINLTGKNNIDIGNAGVAGESFRIRIGTTGIHTNTYIAGISGVTVAGGVAVIIDSDGHLGTVVSSGRFKDNIKPMDKASEAILALKPVTFRYKQELDPEGIPQFGLMAEEVEKVNPDLVARDASGKVYTVRYEAVNAMLLNEFLKEHRKVEEQGGMVQEQQATIAQLKSAVAREEAVAAQQQKQIMALTATVQKVSDEVKMSRPAPQMVGNNQ